MRTNRRQVGAWVLAAVFTTGWSGAAAGQVTVRSGGQDPGCGERGSLGISGLRCEGCSFTTNRSGIVEARFRVEPEVLAVRSGVTSGEALRPGDRIVSVDGVLITTREGGDRLSRIGVGEEVRLRVRRNGELRDLQIVAGDACAVPPAPTPLPPAPGVEPLAPPAPGAPLPPTASVEPLAPPPPPQASEVPPAGWMGFGFSCSDCGIEGERWFFTGPAVVTGVAIDGPAYTSGIRPGDAIAAVNGVPLSSAEGSAEFSRIEPGDTVRWEVIRDGSRIEMSMRAEAKPIRSGVTVRGDALRYQGRFGDVDVQVRGAPVTVTLDEEGGRLVIRTSDAVIRLDRRGGR